MRLQANVLVIGKLKKPWTDTAGNQRVAYSANVVQNNGEVIDNIRLSEFQFSSLEVNQPYVITADFGRGQNGGYLHIVDITPQK